MENSGSRRFGFKTNEAGWFRHCRRPNWRGERRGNGVEGTCRLFWVPAGTTIPNNAAEAALSGGCKNQKAGQTLSPHVGRLSLFPGPCRPGPL
jgi:hypothetical protein